MKWSYYGSLGEMNGPIIGNSSREMSPVVGLTILFGIAVSYD